MPLESGDYISDLNASNPLGVGDPKAQGDDHLRLIKHVLLTTFPAIAGAVTPSHTELNYVDGVTSSIQTQLDGKAASSHNHSAADLTSGTIPDARFPSTLPAVNGSALTNLNASNLASGTVADARLSSNVPLKNAANVFTAAGQSISSATGTLLVLEQTGASFALARFNRNGAAAGFIGFADGAGSAVVGASAGDLVLRNDATAGLVFSGNAGSTIHFRLSSSGEVSTPYASASEVGYSGIPVVQKTADYTLTAADNGKTIYALSSCDEITLTANGSSFIGQVHRIYANNGGTVTIHAGTANTLYLAGTAWGTTGDRTIADGGVALVEKISTGTWVVSGVGVS